jgi:beta-lactamase regulating signal transducer with metallopeptidase domain
MSLYRHGEKEEALGRENDTCVYVTISTLALLCFTALDLFFLHTESDKQTYLLWVFVVLFAGFMLFTVFLIAEACVKKCRDMRTRRRERRERHDERRKLRRDRKVLVLRKQIGVLKAGNVYLPVSQEAT